MNYMHFIQKNTKKCCCEIYLHFITCSLNIILKMMNYYDEKNIIPFNECTRIKSISYEVINPHDR
jgi:hypothetical protein